MAGSKRFAFALFFLCWSGVFAADNKEDSKSRREVIATMEQWPKDFNAKNIQGTCGLFAPNLLGSYAGIPDRNYKEECQHLTKILTNPNNQFHYEAPDLKEVIIKDDIAIVRVVWSLTMTDKNRSDVTYVKEKSLDILKRQKDGSWKMFLYYAYPEEEYTAPNWINSGSVKEKKGAASSG